jgi:predicted nucleic acid-binding protein
VPTSGNDALVGATAIEHGLPLTTLDRRALDTYRVLGVDVELLGR